MIKKITRLAACVLSCTAIISCEKDFSDIDSNITPESPFIITDTSINVTTKQINIETVRTDNINSSINNVFLLGVYKPEHYKTVKASIISEVSFSKLAVDESVKKLNNVTLKLPLISTKEKREILGDINGDTKIKVFENQLFLNKLNPNNPAKNNTFLSDTELKLGKNLTKNQEYIFKASSLNNQKNDSIQIPLDLNIMKELIWDKMNNNDPVFNSEEDFKNYFKGIVIKAEGDNGALIPLDLSKSNAKIVFDYTQDTTQTKFNLYLSNGVKINHFEKVEAQEVLENSIKIQGTTGSKAEINILSKEELEKIRSKNIIINNATLSFYVNQEIDNDTLTAPKRLLLCKSIDLKEKKESLFISDHLYTKNHFNGYLQLKNNIPYKYTFGITNYISRLVKGTESLKPLTLKSFNYNTDIPKKINNSNYLYDSIVKPYNWNAKGITICNEKYQDINKRAVLKITYTKK